MTANSLISKFKNLFWGSTTNTISNFEQQNKFDLAIEKIVTNILISTRSNGYFVTQKPPINTTFQRNYKNVYNLDAVLSVIEKKLMSYGILMITATNEQNDERLIFIRGKYNEEN